MLYQLSKTMPKGQFVALTIAGTFGLSYALFAQQRYSGKDFGGSAPGAPKTTSDEWAAASVEYAKVQKANPIRHFRG